MVSRIRASIVLPDDRPPHTFAVWPFPNPKSKRNWWEFTANGTRPAVDVDSVLATVGMQHEKSGPVQQLNVVSISASFDEFLLEGSWDKACADDHVAQDVQFLSEQYGSDYAFVLGRVETSGTYEFEWSWFGETPFIHNTHRDTQRAGDLLAVVGNCTRILWVNPGGGDTRGPPNQKSVRDADRLKRLAGDRIIRPWYLISAMVPPERRRNDDITGESCEQSADGEEGPTSCCLC